MVAVTLYDPVAEMWNGIAWWFWVVLDLAAITVLLVLIMMLPEESFEHLWEYDRVGSGTIRIAALGVGLLAYIAPIRLIVRRVTTGRREQL